MENNFPSSDIEALIAQTLKPHHEIVAAAIYGSWAKEELHHESDIDLIIIVSDQIRWQKVPIAYLQFYKADTLTGDKQIAPIHVV